MKMEHLFARIEEACNKETIPIYSKDDKYVIVGEDSFNKIISSLGFILIGAILPNGLVCTHTSIPYEPNKSYVWISDGVTSNLVEINNYYTDDSLENIEYYISNIIPIKRHVLVDEVPDQLLVNCEPK